MLEWKIATVFAIVSLPSNREQNRCANRTSHLGWSAPPLPGARTLIPGHYPVLVELPISSRIAIAIPTYVLNEGETHPLMDGFLHICLYKLIYVFHL